jgi:hypothetical protein
MQLSSRGPSGPGHRARLLCQNGTALQGPSGVVASPDGRGVYVASDVSDAVGVFDRDPATGALTQKPGSAGCISEDGSGGACQNGTALQGTFGVVASCETPAPCQASLITSAPRSAAPSLGRGRPCDDVRRRRGPSRSADAVALVPAEQQCDETLRGGRTQFDVDGAVTGHRL